MIPLARPVMGEPERSAADRVLRSGRLVLGPEAERFEEELAARTGVSHAVAVSSGTAALHMALWALGVGPGDEVIIPALTFPAPASAVLALGATPVLADVHPERWNISIDGTERALSPKTAAIIAVDQFGVPADWEPLQDLADTAGVALIEDAACSLGAELSSRPCGSFGQVAALSFHPRKVITTGEGGAVLTRDPSLAGVLLSLRDHGRQQGEFRRPGLNFRLGEVPAAIGRVQLARLDSFISARRKLAALYVSAIADLTSASSEALMVLQAAPDDSEPSYQTLGALLAPSVSREQLLRGLAEEGIEAGILSFCLSRLAPFAPPEGEGVPQPVAGALHDRGVALPLFPEMTEHDVGTVVAALGRCLRA